MPDHLLVIRSPDTDYERQGRVRGRLDLPPCPDGLEDARVVAAALAAAPPAAVYTAPSACAVEAGRIIAVACGLTARPVQPLANLDLGLWQGKLVADIRRQQPRTYRLWRDDPWGVIPPEGELLDEARGRIETALERIFRRHRTGRVVVVVPAPIDAVVRWLVSGQPLGDLWCRDAGQPACVELPVAAQWRSRTAAGQSPPAGVPVGLSRAGAG